ncbi:hypothetical protein GCM10009854_25290 [Saccharopolyspora halophila]|uniref:Uncharacterized protein n=1 Tax=Saccharopolyspora halophila TaxID=405551 RepID=A0ABP5TCN8_9PSEU
MPRRPELSPLWILGLAALGVPRVIAHDLGPVGALVNGLLMFVPLVVWVAVVLWKRVRAPFSALLMVGLVHGVLLGVTHQILWTAAFAGDPPELGGNLAGALPPVAEALLLRAFAFISSLVTGALVGAVTGAVAWSLARMSSR